MFVGAGTITNVVAVLVGSGLGMLIGHRLPARVRSTVTTALGLVTLLIAAQSAADVAAPELVDAVGTSAPTLVVLGSLVLGGIAGSLLRLEARLERFGGWMQSRMSPTGAGETRERFIEGFVLSSLVFCVGPLTILGSINEGLGRGADQLLLKSVLDGFASLAFAASFGIGVMASALSVALIQGSLDRGRGPARLRPAGGPSVRPHRHRRARADRRRGAAARPQADPGGGPACPP